VQAATDCRKGRGPVLLVATTFRMGGHATHDEAEARALLPAALFAYWGERDPVGLYEAWLERAEIPLEAGLEGTLGALPEARPARNRAGLEHVEREVQAEVESAAAAALESRARRMPDGADVDHGVYARPCDPGA
jgi:TPP-dependent pyruvate/acetoin dehydrogenase alpha subunit